MLEMRPIPNNHVLVFHRFSGDEFVDMRFRFVLSPVRKCDAIIDFVAVVLHHPKIPNAECTAGSIIGARDQGERMAGSHIRNFPAPVTQRILRPPDLEDLVVEIRTGEERGVVELPHDIVPCCHDVEVEPPIDVVMVHFTHAFCDIGYGSEAEPGLERAVKAESPFRYVPVPASLHLGLEDDILAIDVVRNAGEIASIGEWGIEYGCGRFMAMSEPWAKICS